MEDRPQAPNTWELWKLDNEKKKKTTTKKQNNNDKKNPCSFWK
jgi:hypothetical protein